MGNGENSGTWGTISNTNWNLMEQAVAGVQAITMANANYTLTNLNGVSDEARNMVLVVGGTNSAIRQIIAPLVTKFYIVTNNTVGGYAITIGGASGSLITVPSATTVQVYCDGTNFYSAQTSSAGNFNVNGNLAVSGTSTLTGTATLSGAATVGGTLGVTGAQTNSSTLQATTITATTQFSGAGTGLTGTASALNIGGNAATVTNGVYNNGGTYNIGVTGNAATAGFAGASNFAYKLWAGGVPNTNEIILSWNGSSITSKVDNTNFGATWPINISGAAYYVDNGNGSGRGIYTYGNPVYGFSRANNYLEVSTDIGAVGVTYFTSDENKKENISPSTAAALPVIDAIKTIEYDWKPESGQEGHVNIGVSAQQLRTVNPDFVAELSDGGLMVKDNSILPYLIKAIQELKAEVAALKAK